MSVGVAEIFRLSLLGDVLGALDYAESVHRGLQATTAVAVGMSESRFSATCDLAAAAYNALFQARVLIADGDE